MIKGKAHDRLGSVIGGTMAVVGTVVAICGVGWLFMTIWFVGTATKTSGRIVAVDSHASDAEMLYQPVFAFSDGSGVVHTQRVGSSSTQYAWRPGDTVTVLYQEGQPGKAKIEGFMTVWFGPLVMTLFGLVFAGFAWVLFFGWRFGVRVRRAVDP